MAKANRVLSIRMIAQDGLTGVAQRVTRVLDTLRLVGIRSIRALLAPLRLVRRAFSALLSPIGLVRAAIGLFAARGLVQFITGVAEAGDSIDKFALRLGVSTTALQEYQHVAKITGVEVNAIARNFELLTRNIAEAARGSGTAVDAIQELGLSARELIRLAPEDAFERVVDAMRGVENQADRLRIATRLFGRTGGEVLQIVNSSGKSIADLRREVHELGGVMDAEGIRRSAEFRDAVTRMGTAFQGLRTRIAVEFMPMFSESMESIARWLASNRASVREWAAVAAASLRFVADSFRGFGRLLMESLRDPAGSFSALGEVLSAIGRMGVEVFRETMLQGLQIIGNVLRIASRPLFVAAGDLGQEIGRRLWDGIKSPFTKSLPELEKELETARSTLHGYLDVTPQDNLEKRVIEGHVRALRTRIGQLSVEIDRMYAQMEKPAEAMAMRLAEGFSQVAREVQADWSNVTRAVEVWQASIGDSWETMRATLQSVQHENVNEFLRSLDEAKERFNEAVEAARRMEEPIRDAAKAMRELADQPLLSPEAFQRSAELIDRANIMLLTGRARTHAEILHQYEIEVARHQQMVDELQISEEAFLAWREAAWVEASRKIQQVNGTFMQGFMDKARDALDHMTNMYAAGVDGFRSIMGAIQTGFDNVCDSLFDKAKSTKEAFKDMARDILKSLAQIAVRMALQFAMGGAPMPMPMARGGVFAHGQLQKFAKGGVLAAALAGAGAVTPFAVGGVVSQPTIFPMERGAGLMGEAGPEAIMPLRRMRGGRLGVEADGGGGGMTVNTNITVQALDGPSAAKVLMQAETQKAIQDAMVNGLQRRRGLRDTFRNL